MAGSLVQWSLTVVLLLVSQSGSFLGEVGSAATSNTLSHSEELQRVTTEFWKWRLRTSPEYGTKFGIRSHDGQLEQITESAMRDQVRKAEEFLTAVSHISAGYLSEQEAISLEVLTDLLTTFTKGYPYRRFGAYIGIAVFDNPLTEMKTLISWAKLETAEDYQTLISRYRAFVTYLEQKETLMKIAIRNGTTRSLASLMEVLDVLQSFPSDPEETFLYEPFRNISNTLDVVGLQTQARQIIQTQVTQAVKNYTQFLMNEYKPHAQQTLGVGSLPGGREFYQACLRWHLSLDLTPREIYEMGEEEVKRITHQIKTLMDRDNFEGDVRSYIAHLKHQPENMFDSEEDMLQTYNNAVHLVYGKVNTILNNYPKLPLTVVEADSPIGPTGKYIEPTLDGSREGIFILNTHDPKTRARFGVMALTLHEAIPGHHTQMAYAIEKDIPNFRRAIEYRKYYAVPFNWPFYTAYAEGWALYAESLGEEMGLFSDPKSLLGRYTSEILRACRLVVDTGIHEYGWSAERAKEYLMKYTHLAERQIEVEVLRYASYPGQATAYKIGELTIKRLRKEAENTLGDKFDLREFHATILSLGPVPLSTVERAVRNWVISQNPAAAISGAATLCQTSVSLTSLISLCFICLVCCFRCH